MAYPSYLIRLANYLRDSLLGVTSPDPAKVDAEYNQILQQVNSINLALRGITNADGTLKNLAVATAQSLVGAERFVATASQTVFTSTVITWQSTFTALNVQVTSQGVKIDSDLITVADSGGFLSVTIPAQTVSNVVFVAAFESGAGILSQLQLQTTGNGASLIAIEDAAGSYTGVTVETALAEIQVTMAALSATLTTLNTNAILKTGAVTFAANQSMGGFKLTNLAAGTAGSNDAARMADITSAALETILGTYLANAYLALGGGTMTGVIAMGANKITGLANGTNAQDAVAKSQLDLKLDLAGGTMTGPIAMGANKITALADGVADTDAVNVAQARALAGSFARVSSYFVPGSSSFVVPSGVTQIKVEVWGGGGGGASPGTATTGYGGGGGGYATATIPVTPAETLTLTIGAVGTGGGAITSGGDTKIARSGTDLVTGNGGVRGDTTGLGGAYALDASVSGFGINGGPGGSMWIDVTNGDAQHNAGGGDSPRGGAGGRMGNAGTNSTVGITPGGGGSAGLGAGSNGGAGGIVIYY